MTHRLSDSLKDTRTSALMPSRRVTSAWHSSVSILQLQTLPSGLRTVSAPQLLVRASVLLRLNQVGGETNEITHPTNVSASPRLHETVRGIETGTETGKGIGTEIVIGGRPPVDDMDLRRRGSGTENVRERAPQGGHTRKKKKRTSHQSHCLPSSLGLSARCPNRQGLMVQCLERTTCYKFLGTPSFQTLTDRGPPRSLPHDRLDHPPTMVHTKAPAGVPGDDNVTWHPKLQLTAMARQEHQAQHLRLLLLLACIFSIASPIPSPPSSLLQLSLPTS